MLMLDGAFGSGHHAAEAAAEQAAAATLALIAGQESLTGPASGRHSPAIGDGPTGRSGRSL